MPLRRQASLTLHVSTSTLRNSLAFACDQSRFALLRSCGLLAATSVILFFRDTLFSKRKRAVTASAAGPSRAHRRARITILHCACRVPDERDDVKLFLPFWFIIATSTLQSR